MSESCENSELIRDPKNPPHTLPAEQLPETESTLNYQQSVSIEYCAEGLSEPTPVLVIQPESVQKTVLAGQLTRAILDEPTELPDSANQAVQVLVIDQNLHSPQIVSPSEQEPPVEVNCVPTVASEVSVSSVFSEPPSFFENDVLEAQEIVETDPPVNTVLVVDTSISVLEESATPEPVKNVKLTVQNEKCALPIVTSGNKIVTETVS